MPFGSVCTSLQTGEVEANNALVFVSDKLWQSLLSAN
jgi:TRAP-type C4-dicarboxylate transport system substrate-binding protein